MLSGPKGRLVDCLLLDVLRVETLSPKSRLTRVLTTGPVLFGAGLALGFAAAPEIAADDKLSGGVGARLAAIPKADRAALVYRAP